MSQLELDDNHDLVIENNRFVLVTRQEEVRQSVIQRLKTFRGEWYLDTTIGVPYYQDILKKGAIPSVVASVLQLEILNAPGVLGLEEFSLDLDEETRELTVDCRFLSTDGLVTISEVLG